jgi:hypothetical protein
MSTFDRIVDQYYQPAPIASAPTSAERIARSAEDWAAAISAVTALVAVAAPVAAACAGAWGAWRARPKTKTP